MTPQYTAATIANIVAGKASGANPETPVQQLLIDSRTFNGHPQACFFALTTATNDGHRYVADLANRGLKIAVVKEGFPNPAPAFLTLISVPDVLLALQKLAAWHRQQFDIPVVGITGSNGKTSVKEWLHQLLRGVFQVCRSPGSFNSQIGVPLAVWGLQASDNVGIFEAGISEPGEMHRLEKIIQPTLGIFTNIGAAHQGNFASLEEKIIEKAKLFQHTPQLILPAQHVDLVQILSQNLPNTSLLLWGADATLTFCIQSMARQQHHTDITLLYKAQRLKFRLPFTDEAGIENALNAICTALHLEAAPAMIQQNCMHLAPLAMRLELLVGRNNNLLVNDTYSADPESIRRALDFIKQHQADKNLVVVLTDLMDLGSQEATVYKNVGELIARAAPHQFFGVGATLSKYAHYFPQPARFFPDTAALMGHLSTNRLQNSIVLLKGARAFALEKQLELMALQSHATRLEVNLTALAENLRYFKKQLHPKTKVMAMVKAFGYGGGSYEIAALLAYHHIDYLAVAYPDEGVALREAGITTPIMVMNSDAGNFEKLLAYQLEPEIFSIKQLQHFLAVFGAMGSPPPTKIHLKIETGMHRLGFDAAALQEAIQLLKPYPGIVVQSVFSHLAAAGQPDFEEFTQHQIATFKKLAHEASAALGYQPMRHILNSEGAQNYPDAQLEMVRLGIGLYGISSSATHAPHLRPVSALMTQISQIKNLQPGESTGYNRAFIAQKPTRIATLPIGYADGYRRTLGNGVGKVAINGQLADVVGNICMDMLMVDVTHLNCAEGDSVEIFGPHIPITTLADWAETIPYEMLTSISHRVKRVYFQE